MARRTVLVDNLPVILNDEDPVPHGLRLWGVVHARLVDDVTSQPVTVPVHIEVQEHGLTPRIAADGLVGLVGIPSEVFPKLANQAYILHFTVRADGYQPLAVTATIPRTLTFPASFAPLDRGVLRLRR